MPEEAAGEKRKSWRKADCRVALRLAMSAEWIRNSSTANAGAVFAQDDAGFTSYQGSQAAFRREDSLVKRTQEKARLGGPFAYHGELYLVSSTSTTSRPL
jgi:hypothetical protein